MKLAVFDSADTVLESKEWPVAWQKRMESRDSWQKALEAYVKLNDEQGLQTNGMPKGVTIIKQYEYIAKAQAAEGEYEGCGS
ncbi:short-chain dehydrogenase/reductase [Penicillium hispanicum]|uniref:short-chain dehydrogenase/reductase n=1 Tax=Penicillium hispanicum TaxID=1080232 RepID=UPI0025416358|nr:short-chain dehydrogenase/reductase [Penicillium hispanicum]KAJ5574140.1 short-chain dehydrogenase/reductase [Penicillium hispanicum]